MAQRTQSARGNRVPAQKSRAVTLQLSEDTADMIAELAGALGVTQQDVVERAVNILAGEMSKMAMVMPAWMTEDDEE